MDRPPIAIENRNAAENGMTTLSPLDYAVISQALIAGAREMGVKLIRSAYSTILREARDGSAGPDGPLRQHGGTGRAHPHAARPDRRDAARLPQAPSGRHAQGRRLPDQQRPVRGRPAHPRRLHLHADLRRRPGGRLRRVGRPPSRSRRRRARPQHPRQRRLPGRHPLPAQPLQLPERLERRQLRAAGDGQRARARPHDRRLQRPVRRQRDRRAAGEAALRALRQSTRSRPR